MSADAVGAHMPPVIGLDDLAAMIAADTYGHRYATGAKMPLTWLLRTDPSDHLGPGAP